MPRIHVCPLARIDETVAATGARSLVTLINPGTPVERPAAVLAERHLYIGVADIVEAQLGQVLPFMTGDQWQVSEVVQVPDMRFTDCHPRSHVGLNRLKPLAALLAFPPNPGDHVIAVRAPFGRELLPGRGRPGHRGTGTLGVHTHFGPIADGYHLRHGLDCFPPSHVVGLPQRLLALRTGVQLALVNRGRCLVEVFGSSHG